MSCDDPGAAITDNGRSAPAPAHGCITAAVAVVVPAWDDYLHPLAAVALPSILAQEGNITVWIVDNASRRPFPESLACDTGAVIVRIIRSSRRITVGAARNVGLAAVTDPWTVFWDADEAMPPGLLQHLLAHAFANPTAVAVTGEIRHAPTGRRYPFPPRWARPLSRFPRVFAAATMVRMTYPVVGALLRTRTAREGGGFADTDAGEDWFLGVQLAVRGRVVVTDTVVRTYEQRRGTLSDAGRSFRRVVGRRRALRKLLRDDDSLPRSMRLCLPLLASAHAVDTGVFRPSREAWKWLVGQKRRDR